MALNIIRPGAFRAKLGVGNTLFYELKRKDPKFPKPVVLGPRARGYIESDADAYIESKREGHAA